MSESILLRQCHHCKGSGLIKIKPYVCKNCHNLNILNCMYCENIDKSCFGECISCRGTGREKYKKITNNNICRS